MAKRKRFQELQYAFAAHIRDPEHAPAPKLEDRRLQVYRELFFNNLSSTLGSTFPVLRRILDEARWEALIRDWLRTHRAETPLFSELPEEFLTYLQSEYDPDPTDPPFLLDLAHYEWVELAVDIQDDEPDWVRIDAQGDLLAGRPVLSPLAWPLAYTWPVHRIGPDFQPQEPPSIPTFLIVYRDLQDDVQFMEINAVTARLLELIGEADDSDTGQRLLERIAENTGQASESLLAAGREALETLREKGIILGTHR